MENLENLDRDKFLNDLLEGCQHNWVAWNGAFNVRCSQCGEVSSKFMQTPPPFSTDFNSWDGFGKLWDFAQTQDWFEDIVSDLNYNLYQIIEPNTFANFIYNFMMDIDND